MCTHFFYVNQLEKTFLPSLKIRIFPPLKPSPNALSVSCTLTSEVTKIMLANIFLAEDGTYDPSDWYQSDPKVPLNVSEHSYVLTGPFQGSSSQKYIFRPFQVAVNNQSWYFLRNFLLSSGVPSAQSLSPHGAAWIIPIYSIFSKLPPYDKKEKEKEKKLSSPTPGLLNQKLGVGPSHQYLQAPPLPLTPVQIWEPLVH